MIKEPIIFDLWGGLEYEELEREGIYQTSSLFDLSASNTIHLSKAKGMETEQSVLKIFFSAVDAAQWFAVPVRQQRCALGGSVHYVARSRRGRRASTAIAQYPIQK